MIRYHSIDFVKFFGVLAVVIIHVTAVIAQYKMDTFWNHHWYEPLLRFAVPFFFGATGFFFYTKKKGGDLPQYIWKYSLKILKYYFIFTIFYITMSVFFIFVESTYKGEAIYPLLQKYVSTWNYVRVFNGDIGQYHLWFLPALFYGSLIFILFVKYQLKPDIMLLFATILYVIRLSGQFKLDQLFVYGGFTQALFYISLGYFVASINPNRVKRPAIGFLIAYATYYISAKLGANMREVFLPFITFYLLVLCNKYPSFGANTWFSRVGARALEIYILHLFVRNVIQKIFIYSNEEYYKAWYYYLIGISASFLVPLVIFLLFRPLLSRIKLVSEH